MSNRYMDQIYTFTWVVSGLHSSDCPFLPVKDRHKESLPPKSSLIASSSIFIFFEIMLLATGASRSFLKDTRSNKESKFSTLV